MEKEKDKINKEKIKKDKEKKIKKDETEVSPLNEKRSKNNTSITLKNKDFQQSDNLLYLKILLK